MSDSVKRWDVDVKTYPDDDYNLVTEEDPDGPWVAYEDYAALEAKFVDLQMQLYRSEERAYIGHVEAYTKLEAKLALAVRALEKAKQGHYGCDDPWYSCPKHEDGCCDESQGEDCNCGADRLNAELDATLAAINKETP